MRVRRIDHLVLTVDDVDRSAAFYADALGGTIETFDGGRRAVSFGAQKLNLHPADDPYEPRASVARPGTDDFCLVVDDLAAARERLREGGVEVVHGPVEKVGARGPMESVYVRDPDGNLVEIAAY